MANVTDYTSTNKVPFVRPDGEKFDEIASEELVSFKEFGQTLSGLILFVRPCMVKQKPAVECGLRTSSGNVKFLMNHDLQAKITPSDVGRVAVVVLDSEMDTGADSKMRVYRVFLSKRGGAVAPPSIPKSQNAPAPVPVREGGDPGITDDDIPF